MPNELDKGVRRLTHCLLMILQETQVPHLLQAGFKKENISTTTMDIAPPSECKYYSFNKMVTPSIIKE